ncbi:unnamed protein product [Arctia plantaginis]|uniref:Ig-like domain-containing protein n=1 Tax=Arctia plantaginis TaxID=874455 RepID=A0A8S0YLV6_ARCPL|nr:unnamed protein product [Arctia plantaginis]
MISTKVPTAHAQGVLGKKAALPCDIQPLAAEDHVSMVLWFKETDGEPLYSYDVRGRLATQPKLWSSPAGFGTRAYFRAAANPAVLFVDNVVSTDAGVYRCRVDFKNSPTRNLKVNFTVINEFVMGLDFKRFTCYEINFRLSSLGPASKRRLCPVESIACTP